MVHELLPLRAARLHLVVSGQGGTRRKVFVDIARARVGGSGGSLLTAPIPPPTPRARADSIQDSFEGISSNLMFCCGCSCCLLIQELTHIKRVERAFNAHPLQRPQPRP